VKDGRLELDKIIYLIYDLHRIKFNSTGKIIGDKTPYLSFYLNDINRIFPGSKKVYLLRDPMAVVASRKRNFGETLEQATNRWIWAVTQMKKNASHNNLVVKYEDMIKGEGVMEQIGEYLGAEKRKNKLKLTSSMLGDTVMNHHSRTQKPVIEDRNALLSKSLTIQEQDYILKKAESLMRYYDYC